MLAGTPAYLAPEIARGGDSTRASDVFSLGSTLYHAIEGRPPFGTNTNPLALLHAVASGNVPPPHNAGSLAPTLMSLMRVDPETRPSMKEAAEALATAATEIMPIPAAQPAASAPQTPPRPVVATMPAPIQPVPAQPTAAFRKPEQPSSQAGPSKRNMVIVGAVAALVLMGTLFTVLLLNNGNRDGGNNNASDGTTTTTTQQAGPPQTGGRTPTEKESPSTSKDDSSTPSSPPNATQITPPPGTQIPFSSAGQLVINYYGDVQNSAGRFAMLSPYAQAQFGGVDGFNQFWSKYTAVSSENAHGVTPNADGSVTVPVDVTYTTAAGPTTTHKTVRVSMYNGQLIIDSKAD
jgi:serine/threonine protein kinase